MSTQPEDTYAEAYGAAPARDMVVISRWWLVSAAVGIVMLLIGGLAGYLLALTAYQRGANDAAAAAVERAMANIPAAQAGGQAAAAPTPLPERIADVATGGEPSRGAADAPIVIVEFSDFR